MTKKIKIEVKDIDKLEFSLSSDAEKGDYISLSEMEQISFDNLRETLKNNKTNIIASIWEENKNSVIASSQEFKELESKLQSIDKEKIELENKLTNEYNKKLAELNLELVKKDSEISNLENQKKLEITNSILIKEKELEEKYASIVKEKDDEIQKMEMRRNLLNIKEIGEDLERWMTSEASNYLSLPNVVHRKANTVLDGTKPDFIFEILNDDKSILTSVTVEAKSEALRGASTKKKNVDHIEKLESDRKKNNSEYSLLVTELEKEDDFIFKKVGEYENMYMVRPRYYIPFLQLIYNLSMKQNEFNDLQIDFKDKQDILNEFEEFKAELIETTMNKIASNFEDINKEADKIISSAEKIMSKTRTADKHLGTLENKVNKFKIQKLVDKM